MADLDVKMILRLVDRATGPIRGVIGQVNALAKATRAADTGRLAERAAGLRDAQRGAAIEAAALGYSLVAALKPAIAFESAMGDIKKVIDFEAPDGIARFGDDLKKLAQEIPISVEGLAQIAAAAGQANVVDAMLPDEEKRAALAGFVRDAARMATAFDITAAEAGEKMAGLRNIFTLTQPEVVSLADSVNSLGNSMALASRDLVNVLERAGSTAKMFGLTADQTAALGGAFLALKTPPEIAGTAINGMLQKLATASSQGDAFQEALGSIGVSAEELAASIKSDAQGALTGFLQLIAREEDQLGLLVNLFGAENAVHVSKLVGALDQYGGALEKVADRTAVAGGMQKEFETKAAETAAALVIMGNTMNNLAIEVGSVMLPALNDLLDTLGPIVTTAAAWARENPELVRTIGLIVAGLVAFKVASTASLWLVGGLASGFLRVAGAAVKLAPILSGPLTTAFTVVGRAALLLFANPIGLAVAAVAGAAYLIYRNWEDIAPWLGELWDAAAAFFSNAATLIQGIVDGDFGAIVDALKGMFQAWFDWFDTLLFGLPGKFRDAVVAAYDYLPELPSWLGGGSPAAAASSIVPRAAGGPVEPGQTYMVGERGRELLQFGASGFITPNHMIDARPPLAPTVGRSGIGSLSIVINPPPGADPTAIAAMVRREIARLLDGSGDLHDGAMMRGIG